MTKSFLLVTKTYKGDYALFEQLCASIDRLMPAVEHHILVDRSDLELFEPFATSRRKIICCTNELSQYRELNIGQRRLWWRWPGTLVRGWIFQQLAKLHYVRNLNVDAAVLVDSDAVFIRGIEPEDLFEGDRIKLYACPGKSSGPAEQSPKWHDVASRSLGLREKGYTGSDYISQAVIWSPTIIRQMLDRIETVCGTSWDRALTKSFRFSEYVIYGVFCEHAEGEHRSLISLTSKELCHCSWDYALSSKAEVQRFVTDIKSHHRAVLIQSNLGMSEAKRREILSEITASKLV